VAFPPWPWHRGPLPLHLRVCWGPSRERQRAWGYGRVLKAFSVLSTSFCIGFGPSPSGSHKSLSLCATRSTTMRSSIFKHLKHSSQEAVNLLLRQMKCRKRQRVPILVLLCGSNDVGGKLCSHDERACGAQRRGRGLSVGRRHWRSLALRCLRRGSGLVSLRVALGECIGEEAPVERLDASIQLHFACLILYNEPRKAFGNDPEEASRSCEWLHESLVRSLPRSQSKR